MLCLACGLSYSSEMEFTKHQSSHLHLKDVKPAQYRVCVFGDGGVGKSALTQMFVNKSFPREYDPTIEDSYHAVLCLQGEKVFLDILDSAGQEEYSAMRAQYMSSAAGFILAFSIESRPSFESLSAIRNQLLQHNPSASIVLVGTKADLYEKRAVSQQEAYSLARQWRCEYVECSAKLSVNVRDCFLGLISAIRHRSKPSRRSLWRFTSSLLQRALGFA